MMGDDPERETRVLMTFCRDARFYRVERVLGHGCNGIVFAVRCTHPLSPYPERLYALKMVFNFGHGTSSVSAGAYTTEWLMHAVLPSHPNLNRFLGEFVSDVPDDMFELLSTDMQA